MSRPRTPILAVLTTVLALLGIALAGSPAQAVPRVAQLNVWKSSHCLDDRTQNTSVVQMWSCSGASEQKWLLTYNPTNGMFTFANQRFGGCITAPFIGTGNVDMQDCDPSRKEQSWHVMFAENPGDGGEYQVWQNYSSGYCLTTPSVGNGTIPRTAVCDKDDQYDRWHLQ